MATLFVLAIIVLFWWVILPAVAVYIIGMIVIGFFGVFVHLLSRL
jgi:hypothetical protein